MDTPDTPDQFVEVDPDTMWMITWSPDDLFWIVRNDRNQIVKRCPRKCDAVDMLDNAAVRKQLRDYKSIADSVSAFFRRKRGPK